MVYLCWKRGRGKVVYIQERRVLVLAGSEWVITGDFTHHFDGVLHGQKSSA